MSFDSHFFFCFFVRFAWVLWTFSFLRCFRFALRHSFRRQTDFSSFLFSFILIVRLEIDKYAANGLVFIVNNGVKRRRLPHRQHLLDSVIWPVSVRIVCRRNLWSNRRIGRPMSVWCHSCALSSFYIASIWMDFFEREFLAVWTNEWKQIVRSIHN